MTYIPQKKVCPKCGVEKTELDFNITRGRHDGLDIWCRNCKRLDRVKKREEAWHRELIRKYGMTAEEYHRKFKDQDGVCAICYRGNPDGSKLSVDHCHKTGINRGLLCNSCNPGLGHFYDNKILLREAISYLEKWHPEKVTN